MARGSEVRERGRAAGAGMAALAGIAMGVACVPGATGFRGGFGPLLPESWGLAGLRPAEDSEAFSRLADEVALSRGSLAAGWKVAASSGGGIAEASPAGGNGLSVAVAPGGLVEFLSEVGFSGANVVAARLTFPGVTASSVFAGGSPFLGSGIASAGGPLRGLGLQFQYNPAQVDHSLVERPPSVALEEWGYYTAFRNCAGPPWRRRCDLEAAVGVPASMFDSIWGNVTFTGVGLVGRGAAGANVTVSELGLVSLDPRNSLAASAAIAAGADPESLQGGVLREFLCRLWRFAWCVPETPDMRPPPRLPAPGPVPPPRVPRFPRVPPTPELPPPRAPGAPRPAPGVPGAPRDGLPPRAEPSLEDYGRVGSYEVARETTVTIPRGDGFGPGSFTAVVTAPVDAPRPMPAVVYGHGMGATPAVYRSTFRHLASHGFYVVAPNPANLFDGNDQAWAVRWLAAQNATEDAELAGGVGKIAISGHSMGGQGTCAAGNQVGDLVSALAPSYAASSTRPAIDAPVFAMAGTADMTTPASSIRRIIHDGNRQSPKVFANLQGSGHLEPCDTGPRRFRRYLTAFFAYALKGDTSVADVFWADDGILAEDRRMAAVDINALAEISLDRQAIDITPGQEAAVTAEVVNNGPSESTIALNFRTSGSANVTTLSSGGALVVPPGGSALMLFSVKAASQATMGTQSAVDVYVSDERYGPTVSATFIVSIQD